MRKLTKEPKNHMRKTKMHNLEETHMGQRTITKIVAKRNVLCNNFSYWFSVSKGETKMPNEEDITSDFSTLYLLLSRLQKKIYCYMYKFCTRKKITQPSHSYIAKKLGCSRRTVIRAFKLFASYGWLEIDKRFFRTSRYYIPHFFLKLNPYNKKLFDRNLEPKECKKNIKKSADTTSFKPAKTTQKITQNVTQNVTLNVTHKNKSKNVNINIFTLNVYVRDVSVQCKKNFKKKKDMEFKEKILIIVYFKALYDLIMPQKTCKGEFLDHDHRKRRKKEAVEPKIPHILQELPISHRNKVSLSFYSEQALGLALEDFVTYKANYRVNNASAFITARAKVHAQKLSAQPKKDIALENIPISDKDKSLLRRFGNGILRLALRDVTAYVRGYKVFNLPAFITSRCKFYLQKLTAPNYG